MTFNIYNTDLTALAVLDVFNSAIWTERYYDSGDFEIYARATTELLSICQLGRFIVRGDDTTKAGIIEQIKIETDAEDGDHIVISGRTVSALLARRIIWLQTTYTGLAEKAIRRMVIRNIIEPDSSDREIESISLGAESGLTEEMQGQYSGENLEDVIKAICKDVGIGYKLSFNRSTPGFVFTLYEGADRSTAQSVNSWVIFSPEFDNLASTEYITSLENYKNVAQVAGEGEGIAKALITVGTASGISRLEMRVDGSGASTNSGEYDSTTYAGILAQRGAEELAKCSTSEAVSGSVLQSQFVIGTDYNLGDIVEIKNQYGISMQARVTEVVENWSDSGYTMLPTFADV